MVSAREATQPGRQATPARTPKRGRNIVSRTWRGKNFFITIQRSNCIWFVKILRTQSDSGTHLVKDTDAGGATAALLSLLVSEVPGNGTMRVYEGGSDTWTKESIF